VALAEHVEKLVKAKEEQDRKHQEVQKVVSPRMARWAAAGLGTRKSGMSLAKQLSTMQKNKGTRTLPTCL